MKYISTIFLIAITLISHSIFSQVIDSSQFKFPNPVGYVNDFEGVFSEEQKTELTKIITNFEKETSVEIVIVSITSYSPYENLFDYSLDLANHWGVGKKEKNNGIAIVFGMQIHEIRIQIGYGLEDVLADEEAKGIIDHTIIPEFMKGDVYSGIKRGLLEIIKELKSGTN